MLDRDDIMNDPDKALDYIRSLEADKLKLEKIVAGIEVPDGLIDTMDRLADLLDRESCARAALKNVMPKYRNHFGEICTLRQRNRDLTRLLEAVAKDYASLVVAHYGEGAKPLHLDELEQLGIEVV